MSLPQDFIVEILAPAETTLTGGDEMIVEFGNINITGDIAAPEIIEVMAAPPVGGGYDRVEVLPFTRQGPLIVTFGGAEFPIKGGTYKLESIAGRVSVAPQGTPVIVDIFKNNISIFEGNLSARPTIADGQNDAVIGVATHDTYTDGDFLEVLIVQVGSVTPGENITISIRLTRIG